MTSTDAARAAAVSSGEATISAKVTRADGTVEDLGVLANLTQGEIDAVLATLRPAAEARVEAHDAEAADRAHAANEAESARNREANERAAAEALDDDAIEALRAQLALAEQTRAGRVE